MYACQIYRAAQRDLPTLEEDIARGHFSELREWLRDKVHSQGSLYPSGDELLERVTGDKLKPELFIDYLRTKYTQLYKM